MTVPTLPRTPLSSKLVRNALLSTTLVVLAAAITGAAATAQQRTATRSYVHSTLNNPATPLRARPRTIRMEGSGGISYTQLRWSSWGAPRTYATGRQCSSRSGGPCAATRIRLSSRRRTHGRLVYRCLRPLKRGEVTICLP